ncbi:hypothetical protein K470DRAFT_268503 [Piedraia hortae CBS 480.64]|uniref:Uncharacterized protein n=1 Tax=Piedraia hortae CBS 480.64 TaxID=1314780 RepID=A0A6A7C6D1_9PEZI|nr:hypothetical protein K470DRAFT_268503 [Piedraia hortae CBS 480.64]
MLTRPTRSRSGFQEAWAARSQCGPKLFIEPSQMFNTYPDSPPKSTTLFQEHEDEDFAAFGAAQNFLGPNAVDEQMGPLIGSLKLKSRLPSPATDGLERSYPPSIPLSMPGEAELLYNCTTEAMQNFDFGFTSSPVAGEGNFLTMNPNLAVPPSMEESYVPIYPYQIPPVHRERDFIMPEILHQPLHGEMPPQTCAPGMVYPSNSVGSSVPLAASPSSVAEHGSWTAPSTPHRSTFTNTTTGAVTPVHEQRGRNPVITPSAARTRARRPSSAFSPKPNGHNTRTRGGAGSKHHRAKSMSTFPSPDKNGFVNLTANDSTKILSGVAPSGSSKTKARREKELAEKQRRLSLAALKAVQKAGGDVGSLHLGIGVE